MIGIGAGIAARSSSVGGRFGAVAIGYVVAVALHSLWNTSASMLGGGVFLVVYGFVMVPVFLGLVAVVVWQRRREQRIVASQLPGFAAAGWIVPSEVPLLSSLAGRQGWRAAVRRRSGRRVAKAVAEYQAAVTELAFLRDRMSRGTVGPLGPMWHAEAVEAVRQARARAVGHPEALTVAMRHHGPPGWTPPPPGPPPAPPPGHPVQPPYQPGYHPQGPPASGPAERR
jgi:protease PrsW